MQRKNVNKLIGILIQLAIVTSIFTIVYTSSAEEIVTTQKVTFKVNGMTCKICPLTIKTALKRLDGVVNTEVSYEDKKATVVYEEDKVSEIDMVEVIKKAGFEAKVIY